MSSDRKSAALLFSGSLTLTERRDRQTDRQTDTAQSDLPLCLAHLLQGPTNPADRQHDDELAEADLVAVLRPPVEVLQALVDVGVPPLLAEVHVRLAEPLLELILGDVALVAVVNALENSLWVFTMAWQGCREMVWRYRDGENFREMCS